MGMHVHSCSHGQGRIRLRNHAHAPSCLSGMHMYMRFLLFWHFHIFGIVLCKKSDIVICTWYLGVSDIWYFSASGIVLSLTYCVLLDITGIVMYLLPGFSYLWYLVL